MAPLMKRILAGEIDPSFLITHRMALEDAPQRLSGSVSRRTAERPGWQDHPHGHNRWDWAGRERGELLVGSDAFPPSSFALRRRRSSSRQTSPEELLAGAHSASLAMAVSAALTAAHHPSEHVRVDAACEVDGRTALIIGSSGCR